MQWLVGFLQNLPSLDRLLLAVGNLLRGLNLAFVLFVFGWLALVFNDLGFAPRERLALISLFVALDVLIVIIEVALAVRGEWLYSPYERGLARGQKFGTEDLPRSQRQAMNEPKEAPLAELPSPSKEKDSGRWSGKR